ncbi:hypothetical protein E2C01_009654 [Portunus trituberculatus]|uniref:Uncharacterized protein n=1 Tax=Portunus trituberculatus TaxID=210409 RepID=A0A5B7D6J9_PORTR|nr:hypothetical protein [Portunus trituberculatus]
MTAAGQRTKDRRKRLNTVRGDEVYYEHECSAQGGICAKVEFCPKDGKMTDGLCPKQQADGVECCQKRNAIVL